MLKENFDVGLTKSSLLNRTKLFYGQSLLQQTFAEFYEKVNYEYVL
jgi:hypothetical protein